MSISTIQRQSVSPPADAVEPIVRHFLPPAGLREVASAQFLRWSLHLLFKPVMRPPWPLFVQRAVLHGLSVAMLGASGVTIRHERIGGMPVERITPKGRQPRHAVLYLHGGAFCTG
ncbi:MAG: alpha/beta hydrolase, partial [Pseudomonadota bacterium]